MLKIARQTQIRRTVEEKGQVSVAELSALFAVSEATIRRDLEELAGLGWIRRTHGGAVSVQRARKELPVMQRVSSHEAEKQRIARLAAAQVQEGETLFLGSGSTVQVMAPYLLDIPDLTVITNSLSVTNQLANSAQVELIVIGGMFRPSELSMVGHIAEQAIREFRADRVFMGMRGIDPRHGFTSDYLPEAMTDRAILEIAPHNVIVADNSKFGRVSTVFLAPVTAAHEIITDDGAPEEIISELQELGLDVLLA